MEDQKRSRMTEQPELERAPFRFEEDPRIAEIKNRLALTEHPSYSKLQIEYFSKAQVDSKKENLEYEVDAKMARARLNSFERLQLKLHQMREAVFLFLAATYIGSEFLPMGSNMSFVTLLICLGLYSLLTHEPRLPNPVAWTTTTLYDLLQQGHSVPDEILLLLEQGGSGQGKYDEFEVDSLLDPIEKKYHYFLSRRIQKGKKKKGKLEYIAYWEG